MMGIRSAPLWIAKPPAIGRVCRKRPLNGVRPMMTMDSLLGNFRGKMGRYMLVGALRLKSTAIQSCMACLNFRAFVRQLPEDPHAFLQLALSELVIPEARVEPLCYRLLMTLPGWAGHLRYKDRERELRGDRGTCYPSYWPFCSLMSWPCTKSCKIMRMGHRLAYSVRAASAECPRMSLAFRFSPAIYLAMCA